VVTTLDMTGGGKRRPEAERFWEKVEKGPGCWLWKGGGTRYGTFRRGSRSDGTYRLALAHRVAWELEHGLTPDGFVCHTCDTPKCVRPDHLYLGTPQSNMNDKVRRGRHVSCPGESNGMCKFSDEVVQEIRDRRARGEGTYRGLAEEYGISKTHIWRLLTGRRR